MLGTPVVLVGHPGRPCWAPRYGVSRPSTGNFRLVCADYRHTRPANVRKPLLGTPVVLVGDPGKRFGSPRDAALLAEGLGGRPYPGIHEPRSGVCRASFVARARGGSSIRFARRGQAPEGARQLEGGPGEPISHNAGPRTLGGVPANSVQAKFAEVRLAPVRHCKGLRLPRPHRTL